MKRRVRPLPPRPLPRPRTFAGDFGPELLDELRDALRAPYCLLCGKLKGKGRTSYGCVVCDKDHDPLLIMVLGWVSDPDVELESRDIRQLADFWGVA